MVTEKTIELSEEEKFAKLDEIIEKNQGQEGILINVLHQAQQIFGHVARKVQLHIAEGLDIPFSKVYAVVSFYSLFSTDVRGRYTIEVCTGTACYVKGAEDILEKLKTELEIDPGETTDDGLFTLETTRCIGACGMAPIIKIGDNTHGRLEEDQIPDLLSKYE
ncbi:NAD(P)H-dependent oxidoreductase subunit E [Sporohalobacter salinus]|uniref:NADH-quinone oxidoreductase subunit NuoE family protein n=1 Tax=Sporohalobacter salinus TaxID=1494606 RepID=UPI0030B84291|nr:NADH:ubiquinone oxidoreductase subunit E [Sporohalobacter salinus]